MAKAQPIRITTAGRSPAEDIAARQRRYTISMSIRTLCFVGAVIAGLCHVGWLWPILIVAALFLPYIAVVMANNTDRRRDDGGALIGAAPGRGLPAGSDTADGRHELDAQPEQKHEQKPGEDGA